MTDITKPHELAVQLLHSQNIADINEAFAKAFIDLHQAADNITAERIDKNDEDTTISDYAVSLSGVLQHLIDEYDAETLCKWIKRLDNE